MAAIATIAISRIIRNSRQRTFIASYDNIVTQLQSEIMINGEIKDGDINNPEKIFGKSNTYNLKIVKLGKKVNALNDDGTQKKDADNNLLYTFSACGDYKVSVTGKSIDTMEASNCPVTNGTCNDTTTIVTYISADGSSSTPSDTTECANKAFPSELKEASIKNYNEAD